jgi:diacylglycerol kinase
LPVVLALMTIFLITPFNDKVPVISIFPCPFSVIDELINGAVENLLTLSLLEHV